MDYLGHTIVNDRHDSLIISVKREYVRPKKKTCVSGQRTCQFQPVRINIFFNVLD